MKYKKPIITFGMVGVIGLVTVYSLQLIHRVVFSIAGFGVGYLVYTGILFSVGIWLIAGYGSRLKRSDDIVHAFIFSGVVGMGVGIVMAAMIGVSILLMQSL